MQENKYIYLETTDKNTHKIIVDFIKGFLGDGVNSIGIYDNEQQLRRTLKVFNDEE